MAHNQEFNSDEEGDKINEAIGIQVQPRVRKRADAYQRAVIENAEAMRANALKRVKKVDFTGSPARQDALRRVFERFKSFRAMHHITDRPSGDHVIRFLHELIHWIGGTGVDKRRKYTTVESDLRNLKVVLRLKYEGYRLTQMENERVEMAFHQFLKIDESITKNPAREKQALRLTTVKYLNEVLLSYTIANGLSWNTLLRNLTLLTLLSVLGVRVGELTLNDSYLSQNDFLKYTLLWKDITFSQEESVTKGYGGVALRAFVTCRNCKGDKDDPSKDAPLEIFSLQPNHFLVDPIALLVALGVRMAPLRATA